MLFMLLILLLLAGCLQPPAPPQVNETLNDTNITIKVSNTTLPEFNETPTPKKVEKPPVKKMDPILKESVKSSNGVLCTGNWSYSIFNHNVSIYFGKVPFYSIDNTTYILWNNSIYIYNNGTCSDVKYPPWDNPFKRDLEIKTVIKRLGIKVKCEEKKINLSCLQFAANNSSISSNQSIQVG